MLLGVRYVHEYDVARDNKSSRSHGGGRVHSPLTTLRYVSRQDDTPRGSEILRRFEISIDLETDFERSGSVRSVLLGGGRSRTTRCQNAKYMAAVVRPGPSRESQFDLQSLGRHRDTATPTGKFYRRDRRHGGRATRVMLTLRMTRTRWNIRGCRWQRWFQPLSCPAARPRSSSYYSRVSAAKL